MIGLCVRYQACESTWIALQVAEFLQTTDRKFSILSVGGKAKKVHTKWDKKVKSDEHVRFNDWASHCSKIIWFDDISEYHLERAKRHKTKTIATVAWDDTPCRACLYPKMDKLVSFSPSLTNRLKHGLKLSNTAYVPLDVYSISSVFLKPNNNKPRILLNLRSPRSHQLGSALVPMLTRLFNQVTADWVIWCKANLRYEKSWIHKCFKFFSPMSTYKFVTNSDWDTQRLVYNNTDLTLWPVIHGGSGFHVLMSLAMGSPVVTFDVPPSNEYLTKDNGILAPCQVAYTNTGVIRIIPDLPRFETAVTRIVQSGTLNKYKSQTRNWGDERRQLFMDSWDDVLKQ